MPATIVPLPGVVYSPPMKLPRAPLAVIFDMDGLLFDTEALYRDAIMAAAAEGGHEMTQALFLSLIGHPWPVDRTMLLKHYGPTFQVEAFSAAWLRHFERLLKGRAPLKPGAAELLDTLDELSLPRAIATSSPHKRVEQHLTAHDLVSRFHAVVAHGDYVTGKPAPDPFLRAAERLGVEPRSCLALEDSYNGIRSASAAGTMTVMVPDLLEPTDEMRGLCTLVARDLHEVRELLLAAVLESAISRS